MGKYGTSFIKWSQVCQGSARTHKHINYLAAVSLRGRREVGTGGEAMTSPRTDIINYYGGVGGTSRFHLASTFMQQDVFSSAQTITGDLDRKSEWPFLTPCSVQSRKEEMPRFFFFFSSPLSEDLISFWQDMTCFSSVQFPGQNEIEANVLFYPFTVLGSSMGGGSVAQKHLSTTVNLTLGF